ncbi:MAG TPA: hypothetical protein VFZ01_06445, partial [Geminicoccaceae bacterium]
MTGAGAPQAAPSGPVGLDRDELVSWLRDLGVAEQPARMRARQVWNWLYVRGATRAGEMTNLPLGLRDALAAGMASVRPELVREQVSADGTRKWLLRLAGGQEVETVFIPEADRGAVCVSTQVGCSLTC